MFVLFSARSGYARNLLERRIRDAHLVVDHHDEAAVAS